MTHRNADPEIDPSAMTPERFYELVGMVAIQQLRGAPVAPHRNADQRIREVFDALRAELRDIFGPENPDSKWSDARFEYDSAMRDLSYIQDGIHDFAKLPADA